MPACFVWYQKHLSTCPATSPPTNRDTQTPTVISQAKGFINLSLVLCFAMSTMEMLVLVCLVHCWLYIKKCHVPPRQGLSLLPPFLPSYFS